MSGGSNRYKSKNLILLCNLLLIALCLLMEAAQAGEDFYALLGVAKDAETSAIKKAFKKKALEYHPDKNPGK